MQGFILSSRDHSRKYGAWGW